MNLGWRGVLVGGVLVATGAAAGAPVTATAAVERDGGGVTTRVSVADDGTQAKGDSALPSISANGRYVAFTSKASNLVPGDTNGTWDVFVSDRKTGTIRRVSVSSDGAQGSGDSDTPSISANGRLVAFRSYAPELVPDDANDAGDIFVHDLRTGTTKRVSVDDDGERIQGFAGIPKISGNGRFVLFETDDNRHRRPLAFIRDRVAGTTESIPTFRNARISEQGRFVAFSTVTGLAPKDTDRAADVYLLDRRTGSTRLVSTKGYFRNDLTMSGNGRYVAYSAASRPGVRYGSRFVQVYLRDMWMNTVRIVSVNSRGVPSSDGSALPVLSGDGHYVVFVSRTSNMAPSTMRSPQLFGHDLRTGVTQVISVNGSGKGSDRGAGSGWRRGEPGTSVSANGRVVAFASGGRNLVPGDTNRSPDIFVRVRPR